MHTLNLTERTRPGATAMAPQSRISYSASTAGQLTRQLVGVGVDLLRDVLVGGLDVRRDLACHVRCGYTMINPAWPWSSTSPSAFRSSSSMPPFM